MTRRMHLRRHQYIVHMDDYAAWLLGVTVRVGQGAPWELALAAFLVFEISINNREEYESYRASAQPLLNQHGGRFLVRSVAGSEGRIETLEGDWQPERFFIVEFPSWDQARSFYFSQEYQDAVRARFTSSVGKAILVDGMPWSYER